MTFSRTFQVHSYLKFDVDVLKHELPFSCTTSEPEHLDESVDSGGWDSDTPPPPDALVTETSLGLKRVSWLSWWAQVILTTVSAVILFFARNVASVREAQVNFFLPGTGA